MKIRNRDGAFTLIELLVVITIIAILAGIALPVYTQVQIKGNQTKALNQAKQIGLGLRLYSGDNDGNYPSYSAGTTIVTTSNQAFRQLIPTYVPSEKIFYVAKSLWSPTVPDEDFETTPAAANTKALKAGENHWSFVPGFFDTSNPNWPLIADGFKNAATGTYSKSDTEKGGVWKGEKAIVLRNDQSAALEKTDLTAADPVVLGPTGGSTKANIFLPASWTPSQLPNAPVPPL